MKKIWIGLAIVVVVIGLYVYLGKDKEADGNNTTATSGQEQSSESTETESSEANNTTGGSEATTPPSAQAGAYVDYSSKVIADTEGTKVLFFHASWCPQCRSLDSSIKASSIPDGVTIIKVDYDTNQALRQKYGVTIQTTLVKIDDDGNLVKKYVAYDSPTFSAVQSNLL